MNVQCVKVWLVLFIGAMSLLIAFFNNVLYSFVEIFIFSGSRLYNDTSRSKIPA